MKKQEIEVNKFLKNLMRAEPDRTGANDKTKESATWS